MAYNLNSGYGAVQALTGTTGKTFIVAAASSGNNYDRLSQIYKADVDGIARLHVTPTLALAQCVAGRGDNVVIDPSYTTALSAAELLAAETKGVNVSGAGLTFKNGQCFSNRVTSALPATAATDYFSVLGDIILQDIKGVVTTIVQTQTCNAKLIVKKGSTSTDICANLDVTAAAVGARLSITGTYANAMIKTLIGVPLAPQATGIFIEGGSTIQLNTSATNTGSVKWSLAYLPQAPGAIVIAV